MEQILQKMYTFKWFYTAESLIIYAQDFLKEKVSDIKQWRRKYKKLLSILMSDKFVAKFCVNLWKIKHLKNWISSFDTSSEIKIVFHR